MQRSIERLILLDKNYVNERIQCNFTDEEQIKFSSLHPFERNSVCEREVKLKGVNSCIILFDPKTNFGLNPSAFLKISVGDKKEYIFSAFDSNPIFIPSSTFKYKFNANNCKNVGWGFSFTVYPGDDYVNPTESFIFENPLNKFYESMMELIATSESKEIESFKKESSNLRIMSLLTKFMLPNTLNQLYMLLKDGIEINLNTEIKELKQKVKDRISDAFQVCKDCVYSDNEIVAREISYKTVEIGYCIENQHLQLLPIKRDENITLIRKLKDEKESLYDYYDILRSINTMSSVKVLSTIYYSVNGILTVIENRYNPNPIKRTILFVKPVDVFMLNSPTNVLSSKAKISIKGDGTALSINITGSGRIVTCSKLEIIISGIEYQDKKCVISSLICCLANVGDIKIQPEDYPEIETFQRSLNNWSNQDYHDIFCCLRDIPRNTTEYRTFFECLVTKTDFKEVKMEKLYKLNKPLKEILTILFKMIYMTRFTSVFKRYINNNNCMIQKNYVECSHLIPLKYKNEWFKSYNDLSNFNQSVPGMGFDRSLSEQSKLGRYTNIFESQLLLIQIYTYLMNDSLVWKNRFQEPFHVNYTNKEDSRGIDAGGLIRDFLDEIANQIFHPSISMFILTENFSKSNHIH